MGCFCPRVEAYTFRRQPPPPPPPPTSGIVRAYMGVPKPRRLPWGGSICLASPDMGGVGIIYIGAFLEPSPLWAVPWRQATDDEWGYVFNSSPGRPPHGLLPPSHPPDGKNMKAWNLIANGYSDLNEWSHSWVMRKPINYMEDTIVDGCNGEKSIFLGERKLLPWKDKKLNNADSNLSKWMILHI